MTPSPDRAQIHHTLPCTKTIPPRLTPQLRQGTQTSNPGTHQARPGSPTASELGTGLMCRGAAGGQRGLGHAGHPSSPRRGLELLEFGQRERGRRPFVLTGRWLPALALPCAPPHPQHPRLAPIPPFPLFIFWGLGGGGVEAWEGSGFVCGVGQGLWAPSFQMQEVCS